MKTSIVFILGGKGRISFVDQTLPNECLVITRKPTSAMKMENICNYRMIFSSSFSDCVFNSENKMFPGQSI